MISYTEGPRCLEMDSLVVVRDLFLIANGTSEYLPVLISTLMKGQVREFQSITSLERSFRPSSYRSYRPYHPIAFSKKKYITVLDQDCGHRHLSLPDGVLGVDHTNPASWKGDVIDVEKFDLLRPSGNYVCIREASNFEDDKRSEGEISAADDSDISMRSKSD
ncbi:hypothetical protein K435DRAFT_796750 [Dendrothele bispora CBS 962.96]|uniref:Uncharacterized protein n=1 Tax=Dendrothele bispora (strain CBS 962.96) TaxID=1314807 RepID=A0A4S8M4P1_DENBC|nr:hypothetical protein K435DRAFT_796750 [Dendrothele bispora CBS 962.96]